MKIRNPILLIWDIDGTLISCKGSGKRAMTQAFELFYGVADGFSEVNMAGRVDYSILEEACFKHGVNFAEVDDFYKMYADHLEKDMITNEKKIIFKGVEDILNATHSSDGFVNIIGTGNCELGAWLKLKQMNLDDYFEVGGFGTHYPNRDNVIKSAINLAREHYELPFDDLDRIYIIGDTPADISCGRNLNVKSIAVATGGYSKEYLEDYSPDFLLDSLRETKQFFRIFE